MNTELVETLIRYFFLGLGAVIAFAAWRAILNWQERMRKGDLYELEQREKALKENLDKLSDADLAAHANEILGSGSGASNTYKKGPDKPD